MLPDKSKIIRASGRELAMVAYSSPAGASSAPTFTDEKNVIIILIITAKTNKFFLFNIRFPP
jgi:hypothetical protein